MNATVENRSLFTEERNYKREEIRKEIAKCAWEIYHSCDPRGVLIPVFARGVQERVLGAVAPLHTECRIRVLVPGLERAKTSNFRRQPILGASFPYCRAALPNSSMCHSEKEHKNRRTL